MPDHKGHPEDMEEIAEKHARWRENVYAWQRKNKKTFQTLSGMPVEPLYTLAHLENFDYLRDLGFPGEAPYVRGIHPSMYRGRTWTHRQLAGFGPPEKTNKRYKLLLSQGATGVNGVFDYPSLRGYDSDDPEAWADAGRGGVAVDTVEDMHALFEGIPIDKLSISLVTCQPIGNIALQSMYYANARNRGIPFDRLTGTNQNDFLMETAVTIAPGVLPPKASFKLCVDAIEYATKHVPNWNPVSFAGYNYREAGCTAPQEIAWCIANAIACCEEMLRRGYAIDSFAPRLSFFNSAHNDFFEEIAKYRAARRVYYRTMKKRFGPENPRSLKYRFHVQTSGVALTAQQPLNNIARASYHGLAAILGGAQSLHVDAYDEALCNPTELSSITALRTQQILQHETGVTHTIDPLGGSYFVEALTDKMEEDILAVLEEIDNLGGIIKAVENGWLHNKIADSAFQYQTDIVSGEMSVVGVNCFRTGEEELPIELFEPPETAGIQAAKLIRMKKERSPAAARKAIDDIFHCCEKDANLMETLVDAVTAPLSEGEVSQTLKRYFGEWMPPLF